MATSTGIVIIKSFDEMNLNEIRIPLVRVYYSPKINDIDFSGKYVGRLFDLSRPTKYVVVRDTLSELRNVIPRNLIHIERDDSDDDVTVEIWV